MTISTDRTLWPTIFTDPAIWQEAVATVLARHHLGPLTTIRAGYPGSHAVFIANGALVVKIYAPFWGDTAPLEQSLLATIATHNIVALPTIHATGTLHAANHDWPYLVMDFLPGERLGKRWPLLIPHERAAIATQLGPILRQLHTIPVTPAIQPIFTGLRADWPAFIQHQIANAVDHHQQRRSLTPPLLAQLPAYLTAARPLLLPDQPASHVILHGDVTADHLLLQPDPTGVWQITGLIDFGDARLGDPLYDFVAVSVDFMHDTPTALQACFAVYGPTTDPTDPVFRRKLTALALLHEYSDMRGLLATLGGPNAVTALAQLESIICGS
jgi:hygromycin-B 7''-O-kinase